MPLKEAVLGLVIERPGYGYGLTQRLEERLGTNRASKNAVYPALRTLARDGLIRERGRTLRARGATSPTWYEATDAGHEYFTEWIRAAAGPTPLRDDFHLKVAFAPVEELHRLIQQAVEFQGAHIERIAHLKQQGGPIQASPTDEWRAIARGWLGQSEIAYLAAAVTSLQDLRGKMEGLLRS